MTPKKGTEYVCEMCGAVAVTLHPAPNCPVCKYEFPQQFSGRELVLALCIKDLQDRVANLESFVVSATHLIQTLNRTIELQGESIKKLSSILEMK